jgi:metal-responsive CopG/Arc/MetJ family transcriptional regulator
MIRADKTRITISIPKKMDEQLQAISENTGILKSNLIHIAIVNFLTTSDMIKNEELINAMNNSMLKIVKDINSKEV